MIPGDTSGPVCECALGGPLPFYFTPGVSAWRTLPPTLSDRLASGSDGHKRQRGCASLPFFHSHHSVSAVPLVGLLSTGAVRPGYNGWRLSTCLWSKWESNPPLPGASGMLCRLSYCPWSGEGDSNPRHRGPKPRALPACAIPWLFTCGYSVPLHTGKRKSYNPKLSPVYKRVFWDIPLPFFLGFEW